MATASKADKPTLTLPADTTADTPVTPAGPTSAPTWPQPCGTCKFYSSVGSLCRYNPPSAIYGSNQTTAVGGSVSSPVPFWPMVNAVTDWCGQYIAKS